MSADELLDMDDIEFQLHDYDNSPGVLLKKSGSVTWTPIATRTRSRLSLVMLIMLTLIYRIIISCTPFLVCLSKIIIIIIIIVVFCTMTLNLH